MKTIVVIPARLKSTRLPNKILLDLGGKPLVQRVFETCCQGIDAENVWIACDDVGVEKLCQSFTNNVFLTDPNHVSGTDRIAEIANQIECDIVVNVQGDEPFFEAEILGKLSNALQDGSIQMASVFARVETLEELNNPNLVKVVTDHNSHAIYFSRLPIPFVRNSDELILGNYKKHLGIYAYKKDFLLQYSKMKVSFLEDMEKLEQLRAIENGTKILMLETKIFEKGIDTLEDLEAARKKIKNKICYIQI
jgi:3-deoxy-manno-octulosonate cytidylyltransferase (CMP-KDO synthetase)